MIFGGCKNYYSRINDKTTHIFPKKKIEKREMNITIVSPFVGVAFFRDSAVASVVDSLFNVPFSRRDHSVIANAAEWNLKNYPFYLYHKFFRNRFYHSIVDLTKEDQFIIKNEIDLMEKRFHAEKISEVSASQNLSKVLDRIDGSHVLITDILEYNIPSSGGAYGDFLWFRIFIFERVSKKLIYYNNKLQGRPGYSPDDWRYFGLRRALAPFKRYIKKR